MRSLMLLSCLAALSACGPLPEDPPTVRDAGTENTVDAGSASINCFDSHVTPLSRQVHCYPDGGEKGVDPGYFCSNDPDAGLRPCN